MVRVEMIKGHALVFNQNFLMCAVTSDNQTINQSTDSLTVRLLLSAAQIYWTIVRLGVRSPEEDFQWQVYQESRTMTESASSLHKKKEEKIEVFVRFLWQPLQHGRRVFFDDQWQNSIKWPRSLWNAGRQAASCPAARLTLASAPPVSLMHFHHIGDIFLGEVAGFLHCDCWHNARTIPLWGGK